MAALPHSLLLASHSFRSISRGSTTSSLNSQSVILDLAYSGSRYTFFSSAAGFFPLGFALDFLPREGSTGQRTANADVEATAGPPETSGAVPASPGGLQGGLPETPQEILFPLEARAVPAITRGLRPDQQSCPATARGGGVQTPARGPTSRSQAWNSGPT